MDLNRVVGANQKLYAREGAERLTADLNKLYSTAPCPRIRIIAHLALTGHDA